MVGKNICRKITAFMLALILILQGTGRCTIADGAQGRSIVSYDVDTTPDSGQTQTSQKLQNGSFEEGVEEQSWNGKNYNQPTQDLVPYWNTTATDKKIELFKNNSNTYISGVTLTPTAGSVAAELNAEEESTLYQNVTTTPASIYQWGLDHGARNGTDTMALVIGPSQPYDPSKPYKNGNPDKTGRDQLMQMVDWLIEQTNDDYLTSVKYKDGEGTGKQLILYSKKFGENGTFQNNEGNDAFSLTPSSIYTEEWHIWIIEDARATSGENPWGKYGSNAEGSAGNTSESGDTELDTSKYYLYTVPSGQTATLFGFVSVGYTDSPVSADKAKTYGNFLDNINFEIFHPLSGSTTLHGSGVVGGSDGTVGGEGSSGSGHEVTVDKSLITYAVDGEPLKVQAVIKAGDASAGCEFVGLYYTKQKTDGSLETKFLQKAGNEIDDTGSLTDEQKKDKWIKSTNTAGDTIYTYYLDNITTATDLHFIFIKSPTVTYDPNGGKPYTVARAYNTTEKDNVYSFKPVQTGSDEESGVTYTFIPPYVSQEPEGQNDGWKFMGWLLTGDKVDTDVIPSGTTQINADKLGTLLLQAVHTIACDYTVGGSNKEQYFKIWNGNISPTDTPVTSGDTTTTTGVKWEYGDTPAYANVHKGLTMVAQWRWRQAFIPQLKNGNTYDNSAVGGTVEITSVTDIASNTNYNGTYNDKGGKSYHAETDEVITVKATPNTNFVFEGWYDANGNLLTTKDTYTYTETKGSVNTFYARFSGSVTQTFIRQIQGESGWTDVNDDSIATLGCYTYTDAVGTTASSTAIPAAGYRLVGWVDSTGASVNTNLLKNNGSTITYITTGDATYYARFEKIPAVPINLIKIWDDNGNSSGRPSNITVTLYADNVKVETSKYTLNWDNTTNPDEWTATITGLPMYTADGTTYKEIVYSLKENDIEHYIENITSLKPSQNNGEWQFTITNTLELQVNLKKLDEDGTTPLNGTKFMLYKAVYDAATGNYTRKNDDAGIPYTTDSQGCISIPIQQTGAYELVETEAATGYELGTTPFDCFFSVKDSDLRQKLDITSKTAAPKGSQTSLGTQPFFVVQSGAELLTADGLTNVRKTGTLTINKKDGAANAALDGVKFMLYKQNSDGSYGTGWEFTTGKKYKAFDSVKEDTPGVTTIDNLSWGNYKLVETIALDGYIRNTAEYLFTVSKDNVSNPIELTDISGNAITDNEITNNRNKIRLIKQSDDETPAELTGGSYRIMKVTGETRQEVSFYTDAAGAAGTKNRLTAGDTVYGLAAGTYEIEELSAPDGYKLNSTPVVFVMDEYGNAKKADNTPWSGNQIIMQDAPVQIALKKTDSSTGLAVTGAVFKLSGIFAENGNRASGENTIANLTVDNFTGELKGKLIISTGEEEGVGCFTYCLEETTAPVGYNLLVEPIKFRLSAAGEIVLVQAPAMVTVNNEASVPEINVRNSTEECSFVVTKEFVQDGIWKNSIRPSQISLQLYAQIEGASDKLAMGNPVVIDITTDVDSYTHTYNNLPVYHYDNNDGASVPKKIKYSVEETDIQPEEKAVYYRTVYSTVSESGKVFSQTITNTAADLYPTGILKIGKTNIGGAMNAMFRIKVTISRDGKETVFMDTYEVYKSDDDGNDSNDVLLRTESASEGYVELRGGEYAKLILPKNVNYYIEEALESVEGTMQYIPTYTARSGMITPNATVNASIVNKANIYTAIANDTENEGSSYQDDTRPKNAGGVVGIVTGGSSDEEAYDKVDYQEGKMSVYWMPEDDWSFTDSFTVTYREYDGSAEGGVEKSITVSGFLSEDGSPKAVTESCYDELRRRYPDMEIGQNDDGTIILRLANTVDGMPYLSKVDVAFTPTVAIINTTKENAGGQVKAENGHYSDIADGKGVQGEKRYPETRVYAKADEGYYIDLSHITIGNVDAISLGRQTAAYASPFIAFAAWTTHISMLTGSEELVLGEANSFNITLPYYMAGRIDDYSIHGRVEVLDSRDGKPTEIAIILEGLSIPVDVGIQFDKTTTSDEPGEGESSGEQSGEETPSESQSGEENSGESSAETSTEQPAEGEGTYEAPSTGSTSNKSIYAFLVLICGLGTVIFTRKRR